MAPRFNQLRFHFVSADGRPVRRPIPLHVLRGVFLHFVSTVDPSLAGRLHGGGGIPPYTSRLLVDGPNIHVTFTLFSKVLNDVLKDFIMQSTPVSFQIGSVDAMLLKVSLEAIDTGAFIDAAVPVRKFRLVFKTPAYFKSKEGDIVLFPRPELLFKNLARIWNELGHYETLDTDALADWCKHHVRVTSYQLETQSTYLGKQGQGRRTVTGFKGLATFSVDAGAGDGDVPAPAAGGDATATAALPPMTFPRVLDMLARFGEHANVGGNRTTGLGAIRYRREGVFSKREAPVEASPDK